jgi:WD40 repeat protein
VASSPDGARQARVIDDFIELDEPRSGLRHELRGHTGIVRSVAFSQDGSLAVSASEDRTARIWDAATGQIRACLTNLAGVRHAEFSPDGSKVVTACLDGKVCLWNVPEGGLAGEPIAHLAPVATARFSSNGLWIVTTTENGAVHVWDTATHRRVAEPLLLPGVLDARFGDDNRTVIATTEGGEQGLFRMTDTVPLRVAQKDQLPALRLPVPLTSVLGVPAARFHAEDITCFQVSPDRKVLATASADRTARLWDAHTLAPLTKPLPHFDVVNCVCFSPDGRRLATSTADRRARVWETCSGLPLTDWLIFDEPVAAVAFSTDGRRLITASGWTWELHCADLPAAAWLVRLAEAISMATDPAAAGQLLALREELAVLPDAQSGWAKQLLGIRR